MRDLCDDLDDLWDRMFKALGIGKNKPASEEQVKVHQREKQGRDQWRQDVSHLQSISLKLGQSYGQHKGDFALGRYELLKAMIKDSIKEYEEVMQAVQRRPARRAVSMSAACPSGGGSDPELDTAPPRSARHSHCGNGNTHAAVTKRKSAITRLMESARGFAEHHDENLNSDDDYDEITSHQVETDLDLFRKEVIAMKHTFRCERDKLDRLAREYEASKKYNPTQRYAVLKSIIKSTTRGGSTSSTDGISDQC